MSTWVELEKQRKSNEDKVKKDNKRSARNELSADVISEIITKEIEISKGILITVLNAVLDDDMLHLKVTLSVLPESETKKALKELQGQSGLFRKEIARRFPNWRMHPKVHFVSSDEIVKESEVLKLLDNLND